MKATHLFPEEDIPSLLTCTSVGLMWNQGQVWQVNSYKEANSLVHFWCNVASPNLLMVVWNCRLLSLNTSVLFKQKTKYSSGNIDSSHTRGQFYMWRSWNPSFFLFRWSITNPSPVLSCPGSTGEPVFSESSVQESWYNVSMDSAVEGQRVQYLPL